MEDQLDQDFCMVGPLDLGNPDDQKVPTDCSADLEVQAVGPENIVALHNEAKALIAVSDSFPDLADHHYPWDQAEETADDQHYIEHNFEANTF